MKNLVQESGDNSKLGNQFFNIINSFLKASNDTLNHAELKRMMKNEKVDLIITGFVFNSFFVGIAEHFDCPVMMISLQPPTAFVNTLIGNPVAASGLPHFYLEKKAIHTFFGRVKNFLFYIGEYAIVFLVDWRSKRFYE